MDRRLDEQENQNSSTCIRNEPSELADLDASIAENAIRMAHLYCERAKISDRASDHASAVRDKARADGIYQWAVHAAESTNSAGQEVLKPELERLKAELEAFQLAMGVGAP